MERGLSADKCSILEIVSLANVVVEDLGLRRGLFEACNRVPWNFHRLRTLDYLGGSVPHKSHLFLLVLYQLDRQESHE